jgi:hypothetical protein
MPSGPCPECGHTVAATSRSCLNCGNTTFVEYLGTRGPVEETCYYCKGKGYTSDPAYDCGSCNGSGMTIVTYDRFRDCRYPGSGGEKVKVRQYVPRSRSRELEKLKSQIEDQEDWIKTKEENHKGQILFYIGSDRAEETTVRAGVAGRSARFNANEQRVAVAIKRDRDNALSVARRFALVPELAARAAPEPGFAGLSSLAQRLTVHVGKHQHLAGCVVLHDGWHKPALVELHIGCD